MKKQKNNPRFNKIKKHCKSLGLSVSAFASKHRIPPSTFTRIKQGKPISLANILKIQAATKNAITVLDFVKTKRRDNVNT